MAKNQCKPFCYPTIGLNTQLDQKINTITASSFQPALFFSLPVALSYFTINNVRHHWSLVYNHNCLYNGFSRSHILVLYIYSYTYYYYHSYLYILSFLFLIVVFVSCFSFSSLTRENSLFACIRQVISRRFSFLFWSIHIFDGISLSLGRSSKDR
jgi:hypothetical protein